MQNRQNLIYLVVGQIGSGKTDGTKNLVRKILSNNPSIDKLVVFDDDDYENWRNMATHNYPEGVAQKIPIIPEDKLLSLKKGYVRIIQQQEEVNEYFEMFAQLSNCVLVIEDATRFLEAESKVPRFIKKLFINVKQRNVELFLCFHSLQEVPAWIARNCRIMILHHTLDTKVPSKLSKPNIEKAFQELKKPKNARLKFKTIAIPINL